MLLLTSLPVSHCALLFNPELLWVIARLFIFVEMLFHTNKKLQIPGSNCQFQFSWRCWHYETNQSSLCYSYYLQIFICLTEHQTAVVQRILYFGAPCSSTYIVNLTLHIPMLSDNCYKNLDGVVLNINIRKLVYSLYFSSRSSDNVLVQTALNSDVYTVSSLFRRWRNLLF